MNGKETATALTLAGLGAILLAWLAKRSASEPTPLVGGPGDKSPGTEKPGGYGPSEDFTVPNFQPPVTEIHSPGDRQWTAEDANWLARALILEAGDINPGPEWAGIAWVAINRAMSQKKSLRQVLATTAWFGGGPRGAASIDILGKDSGKSKYGQPAPPTNPRWGKAQTFATDVLAGKIENPIGKRAAYVHTESMPPTEKNGKPVPQPYKGMLAYEGNWLPAWAVPTEAGGKNKNPLTVGRALFAA